MSDPQQVMNDAIAFTRENIKELSKDLVRTRHGQAEGVAPSGAFSTLIQKLMELPSSTGSRVLAESLISAVALETVAEMP